MGIVVRQSIKSVIVTLLGVVLGGLVTLLSSHYFPKVEYGFTQNLVVITTSVSLFALFGFTSTLMIIGQKYPVGHPSRASFLTICAIVPLAFSLFICSLFFIFKSSFLNLYEGEDKTMMDKYFLLFPIFTLISVVITWMEGYLQSLNKVAIQSFGREVLLRIFYITLIMLYGFRVIEYNQFIWLFVLMYLLPFVFLVYIAKRSSGFTFKFRRGLFSTKDIKEIIRFSGYHMLTMVSMVLIYQISTLSLGPLSQSGLEAVAVFTVASFVVAILRNPTRVMGIAATPTFSQIYQEGKIKQLRVLFNRSAINMQILGFSAFALVYLNIDSIQEMMSFIKEGYGEIKSIILILMIGQLIDMVTGFNYELIGITKYFRFNFWLALIVLVLVMVLNYFLILKYDIIGAAWATTIGLVFYNVLKSYFLWKKYKMQPFNKTTGLIVLITIAASFLTWLIPVFDNVYFSLVFRTIMFSLCFFIPVYLFKFSPEFNQLISNIIKSKKLY